MVRAMGEMLAERDRVEMRAVEEILAPFERRRRARAAKRRPGKRAR
jgi:hypothetical protein